MSKIRVREVTSPLHIRHQRAWISCAPSCNGTNYARTKICRNPQNLRHNKTAVRQPAARGCEKRGKRRCEAPLRRRYAPGPLPGQRLRVANARPLGVALACFAARADPPTPANPRRTKRRGKQRAPHALRSHESPTGCGRSGRERLTVAERRRGQCSRAAQSVRAESASASHPEAPRWAAAHTRWEAPRRCAWVVAAGEALPRAVAPVVHTEAASGGAAGGVGATVSRLSNAPRPPSAPALPPPPPLSFAGAAYCSVQLRAASCSPLWMSVRAQQPKAADMAFA